MRKKYLNIKKHLASDYAEAIKKENHIMGFILKQIIDFYTNGNIEDEEIYEYIENIIDNKGNKIIKSIKRGHVTKVETDVFEINLLNMYICQYKYKGNRAIYFENNTKEADYSPPKSIDGIKPKIFKIN